MDQNQEKDEKEKIKTLKRIIKECDEEEIDEQEITEDGNKGYEDFQIGRRDKKDRHRRPSQKLENYSSRGKKHKDKGPKNKDRDGHGHGRKHDHRHHYHKNKEESSPHRHSDEILLKYVTEDDNDDELSPPNPINIMPAPILHSIGKIPYLFELYINEVTNNNGGTGFDAIVDEHDALHFNAVDPFDELDSIVIHPNIHIKDFDELSSLRYSETKSSEEHDTISESSSTSAEKKKYFGNILKSASSQLSFQRDGGGGGGGGDGGGDDGANNKKQESKTGSKKKKKNVFRSALKSLAGSKADFNEPHPIHFQRHSNKKMTDEFLKKPSKSKSWDVYQTTVFPFEFNTRIHTDPESKRSVTITIHESAAHRQGSKIAQLPNWLSEFREPEEESGEIADYLNDAIEKEYEAAQESHPVKWEKAMAIAKQTVTRDFRNISVYISGKIEFPKKGILKVAYGKRNDFLIVGGEHGLLKLLQLQHIYQDGPGSMSRGDGDGIDMTNFGYEDPSSAHHKVKDISYRVLRHEPLIGHLHDINHIQWRGQDNRIMTTDTSGILIGWETHTKSARIDLVQDQTGSSILGFSWSPDCQRVVIIYHDLVFEPGDCEYGIVMGLSDGTREWQKDLEGNDPPSGVTWLDEKRFALIHDNALSIRHSNGLVLQTRYFGDAATSTEKLHDYISGPGKIVAFLSKNCASWADRLDISPFSMLVVWEYNKWMLLKNADDPGTDPITIQTQLTTTTCADWSQNGLFIAIGGTQDEERSRINVYNSVGKLLTVVKLEHPSLSSVSWDQSCSFLAMGAKNMLYIGAVRPSYKFASSWTTVAYGFQSSNRHFIGFWDICTLTYNCQKIDGQLVEIKSHGDRFAILSLNTKGIYCTSVLKNCGTVIDSLVILTMEPISICFTDQCLVCLSPTSIIFWRYKSSLHHKNLNSGDGDESKTPKEHSKLLRQIHIDDHPSLIPTVVLDNLNEDYYKATFDPAVCMDAKQDRLCVARLSGKLQIYCLPHGGLLETIQVDKFNPYIVLFNPVADTLALVDTSGGIRYGTVTPSHVEVLTRLPITTEAIDLMWSRDMPYYLCILEKTKMTIFRGTEIAEEFLDVNSLSGYLTNFQNMDITLIQLDEILLNPSTPDLKFIINYPMNILQELKMSYDSENSCRVNEMKEIVQSLNQPKLWNLLGQEELKRLNFHDAEYAFVNSRNYSALQLTKRLKFISNPILQRAEIFSFLEIHTAASNFYIQAGRKDLALEMWKTLDDSEQQSFILDAGGLIVSGGPSDKLKDAYESAENLFAMGAFEQALGIYKNLKCHERIFDCLVRLDDCEELKRLASSVPKDDPILVKVAERFEFLGITSDAVNLFLSAGLPERAMNTALGNLQWGLALEISRNYNVPMISQVLLRTTGQLINSGDILQGVNFLEKCGKTFAAGKLLATLALKQLQELDRPSPLTIKNLFVMSAVLIQTKPKLINHPQPLNLKRNKGKCRISRLEDEIDIKFDESIPQSYRASPEAIRWMREDPWRGAQAMQYYIIAQKRLYDGKFHIATTIANHLRTFTDILGDERVDCLLALASAKSECIMTCLGALSHLENIDQEYSDIAPELLSTKGSTWNRKEKHVQRSSCCGTDLIDNDTLCPTCNKRVALCIITGKILNQLDRIWRCESCKGTANIKKIKNFQVCPLCHASAVILP